MLFLLPAQLHSSSGKWSKHQWHLVTSPKTPQKTADWQRSWWNQMDKWWWSWKGNLRIELERDPSRDEANWGGSWVGPGPSRGHVQKSLSTEPLTPADAFAMTLWRCVCVGSRCQCINRWEWMLYFTLSSRWTRRADVTAGRPSVLQTCYHGYGNGLGSIVVTVCKSGLTIGNEQWPPSVRSLVTRHLRPLEGSYNLLVVAPLSRLVFECECWFSCGGPTAPHKLTSTNAILRWFDILPATYSKYKSSQHAVHEYIYMFLLIDRQASVCLQGFHSFACLTEGFNELRSLSLVHSRLGMKFKPASACLSDLLVPYETFHFTYRRNKPAGQKPRIVSSLMMLLKSCCSASTCESAL